MIWIVLFLLKINYILFKLIKYKEMVYVWSNFLSLWCGLVLLSNSLLSSFSSLSLFFFLHFTHPTFSPFFLFFFLPPFLSSLFSSIFYIIITMVETIIIAIFPIWRSELKSLKSGAGWNVFRNFLTFFCHMVFLLLFSFSAALSQ